MKSAMSILSIPGALLCAACATQPAATGEDLKFQVTDRAMEIIEEQGKASAVTRGYALGNDTDLVCERFHKTGSHITTNFCYTREEWQYARANHQEFWRRATQGGPCLPPRNAPGHDPGIGSGCGGGGAR